MEKNQFKRFGWAIYLSIGLTALICFLFATYKIPDSTIRDLIVNLSSELFAVALIFFVVQQFFLWDPEDERKKQHETLLNSFKEQLENQLEETLGSSRASHYLSRDEAYTAVARTVAHISSTEHGEKHLMLAALHGHSGRRRTIFSHPNSAFESFAHQMQESERSSGPGRWYVRELYNVTDEERLKMIVERMEKAGDAEGFEVRAFCLENVLPQLTPMVIGKENTFIGVDDYTYYGIRSAIHMGAALLERRCPLCFQWFSRH